MERMTLHLLQALLGTGEFLLAELVLLTIAFAIAAFPIGCAETARLLIPSRRLKELD